MCGSVYDARRAGRALQLVRRGLTTPAAVDRLGLDPDTVLLHVAGAISTLGADSVPDTVAPAIEA